MEMLNKVELVGIVGSVRQSVGCTRFSVATNYAYKANGGSAVVETTWHNVVILSKLDIQKGDSVRVVGRIRNQCYTGSDGVERYSTEIMARSVEKLNEQPTMQMA